MYKKLFVLLLLVVLGWSFFTLLQTHQERQSLNPLSKHYVEKGPDEVGAPNLVTAIVVTYRGFDTLGEVTILFVSAAIVGLFLKTENHRLKYKIRSTSEILHTAQRLLFPVMILFGIYIFMNGHLTPGGGFQGGAVIATAMILALLTNPESPISHRAFNLLESVSGFSYIIIGVLGVLLAGGFLDNHILPLGKFGNLFSAGAIPLIYSFVGLKVGSELSSIILNLNDVQKDDK